MEIIFLQIVELVDIVSKYMLYPYMKGRIF